MHDVDLARFVDIALFRFLFTFCLSLFVLVVLFFRYKYQSLLIGIVLWAVNLIALAKPLFDWARFTYLPDSEWSRQMLALGRDAAYCGQYFEWCALGSVCGLCAAVLVAFLGRDLWPEQNFLLFK